MLLHHRTGLKQWGAKCSAVVCELKILPSKVQHALQEII